MQAMQCTKCRFCCSSRQSKVSRGDTVLTSTHSHSRSRFTLGDLELQKGTDGVYYLCLASLACDAHRACPPFSFKRRL